MPASIGSSGQVLKVPASGTTLEWGSAGGGASAINDLTNALIESNSLYLGHDRSVVLQMLSIIPLLGLQHLMQLQQEMKTQLWVIWHCRPCQLDRLIPQSEKKH